MSVITTEKLGDSVGAQVHGVTREQLLHDDELPAWTLDALEQHGALVIRDLHLDDEAQVVFSRKLGKVEIFGKGERPGAWTNGRLRAEFPAGPGTLAITLANPTPRDSKVRFCRSSRVFRRRSRPHSLALKVPSARAGLRG